MEIKNMICFNGYRYKEIKVWAFCSTEIIYLMLFKSVQLALIKDALQTNAFIFNSLPVIADTEEFSYPAHFKYSRFSTSEEGESSCHYTYRDIEHQQSLGSGRSEQVEPAPQNSRASMAV